MSSAVVAAKRGSSLKGAARRVLYSIKFLDGSSAAWILLAEATAIFGLFESAGGWFEAPEVSRSLSGDGEPVM
jgi:hypothetical protein